MATNFPTSLDAFTNPTAVDTLDSPPHDVQHADANDAIEALQAKVGVDGSAVTSSLDYKVAQQGLVLVKSQTIGTAVSSVTVTDAFSSTFDNYRIIVDVTGVNVSSEIVFMQLGATTTGYEWTSTTSSDANAIGFYIAPVDASGPGIASVDLYRPNLAQPTICLSHGIFARVAAVGIHVMSGLLNNSTQYTAFTLRPTSPYTLDGGTIRVYGYNNG